MNKFGSLFFFFERPGIEMKRETKTYFRYGGLQQLGLGSFESGALHFGPSLMVVFLFVIQ